MFVFFHDRGVRLFNLSDSKGEGHPALKCHLINMLLVNREVIHLKFVWNVWPDGVGTDSTDMLCKRWFMLGFWAAMIDLTWWIEISCVYKWLRNIDRDCKMPWWNHTLWTLALYYCLGFSRFCIIHAFWIRGSVEVFDFILRTNMTSVEWCVRACSLAGLAGRERSRALQRRATAGNHRSKANWRAAS